VAIELHARGCVVHEQDVDPGAPTGSSISWRV
jgi:hypothetical protein